MLQRVIAWVAGLFDLQRVRGAPGEGAAEFRGFRSGTELDKPWGVLLQEFTDAREAWKRNPLARRIIGLTTAYVVGNGFQVQAVVVSQRYGEASPCRASPGLSN